jgi:hypothetical protein
MQSPNIATLFSSESTSAILHEKKIERTKIQLYRNGRVERFCIESEDLPLNQLSPGKLLENNKSH